MTAITAAMREWSSKTCITFKKRSTEKDYVHFYKGKGLVTRRYHLPNPDSRFPYKPKKRWYNFNLLAYLVYLPMLSNLKKNIWVLACAGVVYYHVDVDIF